jgi:hypothetical protein
MQAERRRTVRRTLRYPGVVDLGDGSAPRVCMLTNVSQIGAQILLRSAEELPGELLLRFRS